MDDKTRDDLLATAILNETLADTMKDLDEAAGLSMEFVAFRIRRAVEHALYGDPP